MAATAARMRKGPESEKQRQRREEAIDAMVARHRPNDLERHKIELVNAHWNRIYQLAMWMTGDEQQAQVLTAQTFTGQFARYGLYRGPLGDEFAIERSFIHELRQVTAIGVVTIVLEIAEHPGRVPLFEPRAWSRMAFRLPPTERLVFVLRYIHEHDAAYVAELLKMPLEEVKKAGAFACERIRELLLEEEQAIPDGPDDDDEDERDLPLGSRA